MEPVLALKKRTQRPQRAAPKSGNPTSASRNARRPSPTSIMPTFGELVSIEFYRPSHRIQRGSAGWKCSSSQISDVSVPVPTIT